MDNERKKLDRQFEFCLELDKEKQIGRQTYLADGSRKENDAEHAWHMAVMALIMSEYANEKLDMLRVLSMILLHDVVEIDAGDTFAYDEERKKTQAERENRAAERIYGLLPKEQKEKFQDLWREFEERKTPEAKFARTMDNIQPLMLNAASGGKSWEEHGIALSQVLRRNEKTHEGSQALWEYAKKEWIDANVEKGKLKPDC